MSIIGLDIGGTKMSGAVVLRNKIKKEINRVTNAQVSPREILKQITDLIDSLVGKQVQAIGVGVPGSVDQKTGLILGAINIPALKEVTLKKSLEKKYRLPIYVNNDANCFALGEKHFGQGKQYNNIAAVTLGTGMGTGLIINGQLYSGQSGGAGEFGQIGYLDGTLEQYSSGQFFEKNYKMSGQDLFEKNGKKSLKAFKEYGYHLGKALLMIVRAVDPEIIILGGSISEAFKLFEKSMKESLGESSNQRRYEQLKIVVSKDPNSALLGAALLGNI